MIEFNRLKIIMAVLMMLICVVITPQAFAEKNFPTISTDELKSLVDKNAPLTLIDARTTPEYAESHIVKSVNIPEKKLQDNLTLLPADKNSLLIIYCNGVKCGKSKRLALQLEPIGFTNIKIYLEGIPVWEEKNLPLVTGPDYNKKIEATIIKPDELNKMISARKDDYVLVDVRDASEYKEGHIPTAVNIPSETFAAGYGVLAKVFFIRSLKLCVDLIQRATA
ncbi:MAG: rhodanese-like domain-containing protein [Smithella sp.]|jgi:rhodanese-related sulfurtransferase